MSLRRLLTWLILWCAGPLVILAVFLAVLNIKDKMADRDIEAVNLLNSFATVIDEDLRARISGLHMLAESSLVDNRSSWKNLYREARGFYKGFGSHVIFADSEMHMLFNTRVPFGSKLPMLPRPKGHSAVLTVLTTGKPAVGDVFFGPIAKEPLIAIAVPVKRGEKTPFFMLTIFETHRYQERIDNISLSPRWSLALLDGKGEPIARRKARDYVDTSKQFVVKSKVSPWSMVLGMPRNIYSRTLINSVTAMVIAVFSIVLVSLFGAMLVSRYLGKAVASLTETPVPGTPPPHVSEIASVRRLLDESAYKRNKYEAALRESEERFRNIFEEGPLGIAMANLADGRFIAVNKALCEMLGYTDAELHQLPFANITHPDHRTEDADAVLQLREGKIQKHIIEKRYLKKNGEVIWAIRALTKILSADGKTFYALVMIHDITERKQAEMALQKYREHLEELVKERTKELEEANLRLQELDRLKSMFIASMSHELRTPLNSIIGFTGIILMGMSGEISAVQKKQLTMVKNSANHLLDLINDVIDVSKIEAGKTDLNIETFAVSDLALEVEEIFAVATADKRLILKCSTDDGTEVTSDRRRVKQILVNLVGNAVKFTETGTVSITVSKTQQGVEIKVCDTGIGLHREDMEKLFLAFSRINIKNRPMVEGTGLGLYLSQRIAMLLGGEITVESEPGRGSEFTFSLPRKYLEGKE